MQRHSIVGAEQAPGLVDWIERRGYEVVEGIEHNDFAKSRIQATTDELLEERAAVSDLLS